MKMILVACALITAGMLAADDNAAARAVKAERLAGKYNGLTRHAVDKKVIGPTYKDLARKYAGDKSALEKLEPKSRTAVAAYGAPYRCPTRMFRTPISRPWWNGYCR